MSEDDLFESLRVQLGSTEPAPEFRAHLMAQLHAAATRPVPLEGGQPIAIATASLAADRGRRNDRPLGWQGKSRWVLACSIIVVAVSLVAGAMIDARSGRDVDVQSSTKVEVPAVSIEAAGGRTIAVSRRPTQLTVAGEDLWVQYEGGPLERRSAADGTLRGTVALATGNLIETAPPLFAFDALWVPMAADGEVARIDAETGTINARVAIPDGLAVEPDSTLDSRLTASPDGVWVLTGAAPHRRVVKIDPIDNRVVSSFAVGDFPHAIEFGFDSLWVTYLSSEPGVRRVDPKTGAILADIRVPIGYADAVVSDNALWTYGEENGLPSVVRIDPASNQVMAHIPISEVSGPPLHAVRSLALSPDRLWVTAPDMSAVAIDCTSNTVVGRYGPGAGMAALSAGGGRLWIADPFGKTLSTLPSS